MNSLFGSLGQTGATGNSGNSRSVSKFKEKIPKGYKVGALQQFTPEQLDLFKQLFSQVEPGSYLSRLAGGDESLFEEMEAPALRQFAGLQGNLASRFSGMGMGARRSSGFQNTSNQAASDFAQQLQAQRQGLQRQAIGDLMGLSGTLLQQRPFERFLSEKPLNRFQKIAGGLLRAAGQTAGTIFGGPQGGQAGYQQGDTYAKAFIE